MPPRKGKKAEEAEVVAEVSADSDILDEILGDAKAGSWRALGDPGLSIHIPGIVSSGDERLDQALGRGGWPLGRMTLLSGAEGAGKTTLALQACAAAQAAGGIAAYVDAEYKLDLEYARKLGCNVDRIALKQPETMEEALEDVNMLIDKVSAHPVGRERPLVIVFDSLNAFVPAAELEGKGSPGLAARVMGMELKKLTRKLSKTRALLFMLSQLHEKIGVMFGDKETTGCGKGPRYFSTIIAKIEPYSAIKESDGKVGIKSRIEISKNQIAPPFQQCEIAIRYGEGTDYAQGLLDALQIAGLVERSGAWYACQQLGLRWQGINGLRELQEEQPHDFAMLVWLLRDPYGWPNPRPESAVDESDPVEADAQPAEEPAADVHVAVAKAVNPGRRKKRVTQEVAE